MALRAEKFTDLDGYGGTICKAWMADSFAIASLRRTMALVVVGFNFVFRKVIQFMVERLGLDTISRQSRVEMVFLFALTFFNTALLVTLDNWSTVENFKKDEVLYKANGETDFN